MWQVDAEGEAFSPACRDERSLDDAVDVLDALERGVSARSVARLSSRGAKVHTSRTTTPPTPPTPSPATPHTPSYQAQQRAMARLTTPRPKKATAVQPTPTHATPPKIAAPALQASLKRLYADGLTHRQQRLKENEEKLRLRETSGLRTEYPKFSEEDLNEKMGAWSTKGGAALSKKTQEEIAARSETAMLTLGKRTGLTSADTVFRISSMPGFMVILRRRIRAIKHPGFSVLIQNRF